MVSFTALSKAVCRPPGPDSTNAHPVQNPRVFRTFSLTELFKPCLEPWKPGCHALYPPQNFRVFLIGSFTEMSSAGLQVSRSRFHQQLSCFPDGFLHRISQSRPGALQARSLLICTPTTLSCFHNGFLYRMVPSWPESLVQISIIHIPCRAFVFSSWLPLQSCHSWPRAFQAQIPLIQTPQQNFRFFLMASILQNYPKLACRPPKFH